MQDNDQLINEFYDKVPGALKFIFEIIDILI